MMGEPVGRQNRLFYEFDLEDMVSGDHPLRRLVVAQDMGSAIKGPLRGDFFWGSGEAALEQAGRMKQKARFFLLLPNPVAERRKTTS